MQMRFLVETTRFELVTPCMSSKYSNQLSYASVRFLNQRALLYHSCLENASLFSKFIEKFLFFFFAVLNAAPNSLAEQNHGTAQTKINKNVADPSV